MQKISIGDSINVSGHANDRFNGDYAPQNSDVNGKNWYRNLNGCMLYFYSSDSGSSPSWNLDDRIQDGNNDWYRGGWARAPSDGYPPLGTRRWVGVGNLTLQSASRVSPGGSADSLDMEDVPVTDQSETEVPLESEIGELMSEIEMASKYFEEQVSEGNISMDQAVEMADAAFERKSQELPLFMRAPARKAWDAKMGSFRDRLRASLPDPETLAAGAAAIGVVGAVASSAGENLATSQVSEPVPLATAEPELEPEVPETPEPELEPEVPETPPPDPEPAFSLDGAISDFENARTLSERASVKESLSGISGTIQIRVKSVERTFGIGLSDAFRGGNTLIANVEGIGEVEVRMPNTSKSHEIRNGHEAEIQVSIADWNAVRKRLVVESQ